MTWERTRRRNRSVRAVVDHATAAESVDELVQNAIAPDFSDQADLLCAVHALWARAFDARLDSALDAAPAEMSSAIAEIEASLVRDLPGACRVLAEYAGDAGLAHVVAGHNRRVLTATGVDRGNLPVASVATRLRDPACGVRRRLRAFRGSLSPAG